jgi:hypothetical protein
MWYVWKCTQRFGSANPKGRTRGRPRRRGDKNIKMDLKTGSGDVNRIKLAQIGEEWRAAVTTEMKNALIQ